MESPTENRPNIVHAENENMHIGQGTKHMEHLHQKIYGVIPLEQRNMLDIPAEHSNQHKVKQENKHIEQNDKPTEQATENEATKMPWFSLKLVDPNRNTLDTMRKLEVTFSPSGYPTRNHIIDWDEWTQDITFTYPSFKVHEPLFPSQKDRELFYLHPPNCEYANSSTEPSISQG